MEISGLIGYGFAAVVWLVLLLLLLIARQSSFASNFLILTVFTTFVSAVLGFFQLYLTYSLQWVFLIESFRLICWSLFLLTVRLNLTNFSGFWQAEGIKKYLLIFSLLFAFAIYNVITLYNFTWVFIVLLAFNLMALVLLEQLFRNANQQLRWCLWPLIIGVGASFSFDFVMYAQGALINQLDFNFWYARGYVIAISMPFLLLSSKRIKDWSSSLFISRDVVFYSSMLLIGGFYLLILAFAGYIIRYIGGQWSNILSIGFLVLGLMVFAGLAVTQRFRTKIRVFITKHFFANKYDYRQEWLNLTAAIEQGDSDNLYENVSVAMQGCVNVDSCAFFKINNLGNCQIAYNQGFSIATSHINELDLIAKFCQQKQWIIDNRQYSKSAHLYPDLNFNVELLLAAKIEIIIPVYHQQMLLGFFVLPGAKEKPILNWEDRDFLFAASKQLGNYLFLQQAQLQLAQSQQLTVFSRMAAFVLHDLKNIQAQLSLINTNAERHRNNPEFIEDVFATVQSASDRLHKVVVQLRNKGGETQERKKMVFLKPLLAAIIAIRNQQKPDVTLQCNDAIQLYIEPERFSAVLTHLIQNAQEASDANDSVLVIGKTDNHSLIVTIEDHGCGMTAQFIEQELFKPFASTKGNAGMGIGVYEARHYIEQLGGIIKVDSQVNEGSIFTIIIPIEQLNRE